MNDDEASDVDFGVSAPLSIKRQHISQDVKEQTEAE